MLVPRLMASSILTLGESQLNSRAAWPQDFLAACVCNPKSLAARNRNAMEWPKSGPVLLVFDAAMTQAICLK